MSRRCGGTNRSIFLVRLRLKRILSRGAKKLRRFFLNARLIEIVPRARLSKSFGTDRGTPVDRMLMELFLQKYCDDENTGNLLEFSDSSFSDALFPLANKYVFHFQEGLIPDLGVGNAIVGDLNLLPLPILQAKFDLIISTQVLAFTKNPFLVAQNLVAMLSVGGRIIGTEPFMSQISDYDDNRWGDYFRFTTKGLEQVFSSNSNVQIATSTFPLGNYQSTRMSLQGIVQEDKIPLLHGSDNAYTLVGYEIIKIHS